MAVRTIPEPTNTDFSVALTGLRVQAERFGVNRSTPAMNAFMQHQAEVLAQLNAEVRWLRNIIHKDLTL